MLEVEAGAVAGDTDPRASGWCVELHAAMQIHATATAGALATSREERHRLATRGNRTSQ